MKKLTVALLFAALVLSTFMVGCGKEETSSSVASESSSASSTESTASESASSDVSTDSSEAASEAVSESSSAETKVMTYADYIAAEMDAEVLVETYVQAKQSWWLDSETNQGKATLYTQDQDGAIFVYQANCSEEDFAKISVGTKIRVKGFKGEYAGEIEIVDATIEVLEGSYVAEATDVTAILGNEEELSKKQNIFASFKELTVVASKDANGNDVAFLYKYNGSGQDGDDLYFNVSDGTNTYSFTVESYLCDKTTDVYAAVKALNIGDKVNMEGFLYWYNGANLSQRLKLLNN